MLFTLVLHISHFSEPDDYRETIAVLTFEPGFTQVRTLLQIIDDNILEDIENFRLSLETTEPRVTLDPEQGTVSITDTDSRWSNTATIPPNE